MSSNQDGQLEYGCTDRYKPCKQLTKEIVRYIDNPSMPAMRCSSSAVSECTMSWKCNAIACRTNSPCFCFSMYIYGIEFDLEKETATGSKYTEVFPRTPAGPQKAGRTS